MEHTTLAFVNFGGLANQLYSQAHLLAFCLEHSPRFSLYNPSLKPHLRHLEPGAEAFGRPDPLVKRAASIVSSMSRARLLWRFHANARQAVIRILPDTAAHRLNGQDLQSDALERRSRQILFGGHARASSLFERHRTEVLRRLSLRYDHDLVARILLSARSGNDLLVGVHIRQGDYAAYRDGDYFFSTQEYVSLIRAISDAALPRRTGFLICSDEEQSPARFTGMNVNIATGTTPADDITLLSQCDCIVGPHSTFSNWASLVGGNHLRWIAPRSSGPPYFDANLLIEEMNEHQITRK